MPFSVATFSHPFAVYWNIFHPPVSADITFAWFPTATLNESNSYFPIEIRSGGKYAIIVDSLGYYGLGSGKSEYPVLIGWKNDLTNFELNHQLD